MAFLLTTPIDGIVVRGREWDSAIHCWLTADSGWVIEGLQLPVYIMRRIWYDLKKMVTVHKEVVP